MNINWNKVVKNRTTKIFEIQPLKDLPELFLEIVVKNLKIWTNPRYFLETAKIVTVFCEPAILLKRIFYPRDCIGI